MSIAYHNGEWLDASSSQLRLSERFVRVGDSFFETILVDSSVALWLEKHYERVYLTSAVLQMDFEISFQEFRDIIYVLIKKNDFSFAKVRIVFYRKGEGAYLSNSNEVGMIATIELFQKTKKNELQLGIFDSIKKPLNLLSNLKSSNALLYILAAKFANENGFSDSFILNEKGNICETSNANIFAFNKGKMITPPLTEGCVAGVARAVILDVFDVVEQPISLAELLEAEAVFISNSLKGIVAVKSIAGKEFQQVGISGLQQIFETHEQLYITKQMCD